MYGRNGVRQRLDQRSRADVVEVGLAQSDEGVATWSTVTDPIDPLRALLGLQEVDSEVVGDELQHVGRHGHPLRGPGWRAPLDSLGERCGRHLSNPTGTPPEHPPHPPLPRRRTRRRRWRRRAALSRAD